MRVARVFPPKRINSGKLLGFADILFSLTDNGDQCITIRGWKIFEGKNGGIQVGPPSRKDGNDYYPVITIDYEKSEGKAFMDHVTEEVAKTYNSPPSDQTNSNKGIDEDDIPF